MAAHSAAGSWEPSDAVSVEGMGVVLGLRFRAGRPGGIEIAVFDNARVGVPFAAMRHHEDERRATGRTCFVRPNFGYQFTSPLSVETTYLGTSTAFVHVSFTFNFDNDQDISTLNSSVR